MMNAMEHAGAHQGWWTAAACLAAVLLVPATPALAEGGTFVEALTAPVGSDPRDVAIGDFNLDGDADFTVANLADDDVSVFLGDGDGHFNQRPDLASGGDETAALAAADFDGDGDDELLVANEGGSGSGEVAVFAFNSGGFVQVGPDYPVGGFSDGPEALVVGDLQGDANLDWAATVPRNDFVQVYQGNGTGAFSAGQQINDLWSARGAGAIAAGDPDGDNDTDLITPGRWSDAAVFRIALWNGAMFTAPVETPTTAFLGTAIASGPFDTPPGHDVAVGVTDSVATPTTGQVEIFDDGPPPLTSASTVGVGSGTPTDIEVTEADGDGFLDLAVTANDTNAGNSTLSVLLNDGAGAFSHAPGSPLATLDPRAVKEADLTGDGNRDLIEVRGAPTNAVRVLLGDLDTDLQTTLSAPATVTAGEPLTYTIQVANLGAVDPADATVVTLNTPAGSVFVSGSPGCAPAAGVVTCALGSIAPLEQQQATVTVTPAVPGAVSSSATVDSHAYDAVQANDTDSAATTVTAAADEPEPAVTERVVGLVVEGTIRVKRPGRPFETLTEGEEIPLGSIVDATNGRVLIVSEGRDGELRSAVFYGTKFRVDQVSRGKFTTAELVVGTAPCGKKDKTAAATATKKKKKTSLFGNGGSGHRTVGRHGSATVRGTIWRTSDSCEGTRFNAIRDSITVRDFRTRKKVVLEEGDAYLAKAGK